MKVYVIATVQISRILEVGETDVQTAFKEAYAKEPLTEASSEEDKQYAIAAWVLRNKLIKETLANCEVSTQELLIQKM